jgi:hypothetical protein
MKELHDVLLPDDQTLFQAALTEARGHDFSPLDPWEKEPPFAHSPDPNEEKNTLPYFSYTRALGIALHGQRLRNEQANDRRHQAAFEAAPEAAIAALQEEMLELWERWAQVTALTIYHPFDDSCEHAMWAHYIQWLGRSIYHLYELYIRYRK